MSLALTVLLATVVPPAARRRKMPVAKVLGDRSEPQVGASHSLPEIALWTMDALASTTTTPFEAMTAVSPGPATTLSCASRVLARLARRYRSSGSSGSCSRERRRSRGRRGSPTRTARPFWAPLIGSSRMSTTARSCSMPWAPFITWMPALMLPCRRRSDPARRPSARSSRRHAWAVDLHDVTEGKQRGGAWIIVVPAAAPTTVSEMLDR